MRSKERKMLMFFLYNTMDDRTHKHHHFVNEMLCTLMSYLSPSVVVGFFILKGNYSNYIFLEQSENFFCYCQHIHISYVDISCNIGSICCFFLSSIDAYIFILDANCCSYILGQVLYLFIL